MKKILIILILFSLVACDNNKPSEEKKIITEDSMPKPPVQEINKPDPTVYNELVDTAIIFHFDKDSATLTAKGKITKENNRITGLLDVDREVLLKANLMKSSPDMNLRFSEIIDPDGQTDGPFGQELTRTLKKKGLYKIIIAPSNMASGKISGDFEIHMSAITNR